MSGMDRTRGALRAAEVAIGEIVVFVSLSESHNRKNMNRKLSAIACDVEVAVGHELPGQIMKAGLRRDLHSMDSVRVAEG